MPLLRGTLHSLQNQGGSWILVRSAGLTHGANVKKKRVKQTNKYYHMETLTRYWVKYSKTSVSLREEGLWIVTKESHLGG